MYNNISNDEIEESSHSTPAGTRPFPTKMAFKRTVLNVQHLSKQHSIC